MRIRKEHAIFDRIKLLIILLVLLLLVVVLFQYTLSHNARRKGVTMEKFLQAAMEPVGVTMYIWGGGWNSDDSSSGVTSTRIGVSPVWEKFSSSQDATYDFKKHKGEREKGLDCSGYVGWVVYNTFEIEDGQPGYVTASTDMAQNFANRGWGKLIKNPKEFLPGDIVSMKGHVWISLGTCADGSVLLVHSSPPGVSLCGTQGKAVQLAKEFMTEHYPDWQKKYPNRMVSQAYLEDVTLLRWSSDVMQDAKEYQGFKGEKILEILGQIIAR